ncbi:RNA-binding protein [Mycolicibacterium insubricum]|uniref:hypothetical protein n=1 Tax=Mycolicibacterium insubricum TaxID=444597 RepID=UPI0021F2C36B|nr:hypothetical protein [Mycolicibacterium insubricum]MCV7083968.1 hypothetical protein [Mycolicibacterium insubricum]
MYSLVELPPKLPPETVKALRNTRIQGVPINLRPDTGGGFSRDGGRGPDRDRDRGKDRDRGASGKRGHHKDGTSDWSSGSGKSDWSSGSGSSAGERAGRGGKAPWSKDGKPDKKSFKNKKH